MDLTIGLCIQVNERPEKIYGLLTASDTTGYSVTIHSKGADTTAEIVPLTIGMTVTLRGKSYEVWSIQTLEKEEGWGSTIFCLDLMKAAEKREEIWAFRASVQHQLGLGSLLRKSEKLMDQGLDEHGEH